ncbi:hypothetical protein [Streptomyces antibioticus]|uniref:hypothetical protein n=1 Tax=Streptomyces antibioticus TaxID=1890 RepID=UPI003D75D975
MSDVLEQARANVLNRLAQFEAAAFRFGQQVRAVLDDLPAGLPVPHTIAPAFRDGYSGTGELVPGADSKLQLVFTVQDDVDSAEAVVAWARHFGTTVEQSPYPDGALFIGARGSHGGLEILATGIASSEQLAAALEQLAGGDE